MNLFDPKNFDGRCDGQNVNMLVMYMDDCILASKEKRI